MNQYQQQIEETIATITNQFHRKPHNFFNEHEFHQYCYHVFYRKKEFSKQYSTLDGKKTNILKPEYPSIARFSRKRIEGDAKGNRAHYDMAILNPEFIQNNNYDTVVNRDIRHSSGKVSDLIAALEFKYITKHSKGFFHEIEYDIFKLSQAREADLKYFLIFCNTVKAEREYFEGLDVPEGLDVRYVTVWEEEGRKMIRVREL